MSALMTEMNPVPADVQPAGMTVDVVTDDAAFLDLQSAWDSLMGEANLHHPFLSFAWVRTWWECFGAGNQLHIVVVKEGDLVVGIAPFMLTQRKLYGVRLRSLEFISNVHTPRFDVLVAPRCSSDVYGAIRTHLQKAVPLWDVMLLCQVPEGSPTLNQISQFAQTAQLPAALWRSANSPYVRLAVDGESYFEALRPKHRSNLRRRMRRLRELGPVAFEVVTGTESLDLHLLEGLKLEGAVWKDDNRTSIRSDPSVELFYKHLAARFAEKGWLCLHFLKVGERRIAFQFAVSYQNRVFLLKPGYDPSYANCSPSNLLCMQFLESAFQDGLEEFDFLGVEEEWKMQWAQATRSHYWLFVFSKRVLPSLLYLLKFRLIPTLRQKTSCRSFLGAFLGAASALRRHLLFTDSAE
jgi:CelD/BcsL family acetyltransferase involved in cellulose biosynthesis